MPGVCSTGFSSDAGRRVAALYSQLLQPDRNLRNSFLRLVARCFDTASDLLTPATATSDPRSAPVKPPYLLCFVQTVQLSVNCWLLSHQVIGLHGTGYRLLAPVSDALQAAVCKCYLPGPHMICLVSMIATCQHEHVCCVLM